MPPRHNRLDRSEFNELFKIGRRYHSDMVTFIVTPSPSPKISVVVGKKVARLAHKRNRLRRITYHQIYPLLKNLSWAVIILVKPTVSKMKEDEYINALKLAGGRIFNSK